MAIFNIDGNIISAEDGSTVTPFYDFPALKYYFNDSVYESGLNRYNLFTMAHISDLHNDPTRYDRFLKFASVNASFIDACAVTGDFVDIPTSAAFAEMTAKETYDNVDILKCVGNHEKKYSTTSMTNSQIYNNWGLVTNTAKVYYYKDYADYNIRVIAINPYDTDSNEADSHYTQTQIDWFINTLKSAITAGYAVIVLRHNFDGAKTVSNKNGFYQRFYWWDGHFTSDLKCSGTPIEDIVHAFQTGGSITQTYTYSDGVPSISVDTSFSSAGHFIAYLVGHYHADLTGYSPKYSNQLYLTVPQGVFASTIRSGSWTTASDLPRVENTRTQDAFNLYSFDTTHRTVKVCRVGSDTNDLLQKRSMTTFAYNGAS